MVWYSILFCFFSWPFLFSEPTIECTSSLVMVHDCFYCFSPHLTHLMEGARKVIRKKRGHGTLHTWPAWQFTMEMWQHTAFSAFLLSTLTKQVIKCVQINWSFTGCNCTQMNSGAEFLQSTVSRVENIRDGLTKNTSS